MTRLIDADALKAQIQREIDMYFDEDGGGIHTAMEARDEIDYAPTVDAVPVRHGCWKPAQVVDDCFWVCSNCGFPSEACGAKILYKYCPVCGAKMDERKEE